MTDKRKDEMPEEVWIYGKFKPIQLSDRHNPDAVKYTRSVSPPVPDDVAEVCKRTASKIEYQKSMDNTYVDCVPISDLETLIRAASTPDAGLVEALKKISQLDRGISTVIADEALAELEGK